MEDKGVMTAKVEKEITKGSQQLCQKKNNSEQFFVAVTAFFVCLFVF